MAHSDLNVYEICMLMHSQMMGALYGSLRLKYIQLYELGMLMHSHTLGVL